MRADGTATRYVQVTNDRSRDGTRGHGIIDDVRRPHPVAVEQSLQNRKLADGIDAGVLPSERTIPIELLLRVDDDEECCWLVDRNTNRLSGERRVAGREVGIAHGVPQRESSLSKQRSGVPTLG